MRGLVLLLTTYTCLVRAVPPPHPDVLAVKHQEDRLHPSLRSPAWRNPHLLNILPLTSLLHHGEKLVTEREAHKIPKIEIYKVLTHAGFLPRKGFSPRSHNNLNTEHIPFSFPGHQAHSFPETPDWETQLLQYL